MGNTYNCLFCEGTGNNLFIICGYKMELIQEDFLCIVRPTTQQIKEPEKVAPVITAHEHSGVIPGYMSTGEIVLNGHKEFEA